MQSNRFQHTLVVEERAVGALQVFEDHTPAITAQKRVLTGDALAGDDDVILQRAANHRRLAVQQMLTACRIGQIGHRLGYRIRHRLTSNLLVYADWRPCQPHLPHSGLRL